jgi:hypothetical protein
VNLTRQEAPKGLRAVTTTAGDSSPALEEVRVRLEAATANSARALLGDLDPIVAHEGNVRLLERAQLHLRIILEPVA